MTRVEKQCYLHCTTLVFPAYGLWLWNSEFVYLTRLIARREMIYQLNNFQTFLTQTYQV